MKYWPSANVKYPACAGCESYFDELNRLLEMHVKATGSQKAREILEHFSEWLPKFKAVISDEYLAWLSQG